MTPRERAEETLKKCWEYFENPPPELNPQKAAYEFQLKVVESALIEARNEAIEECAQLAIAETCSGCDKLPTKICALKTKAGEK